MPDFETFSDLFRVGRDEVLLRNASVSRDAVEREGMDANILVAASAAAADEVMGQVAELAAALYLDSATGDALDRLVFDRYGLTRKPAAASIGSVQFSTTVGSPTTFAIPIGTIVQTAAGTQFVTTEATVYLGGSFGPLTVAVRSVLAGASQNAKVGTITSIISSISGAAADLVVTNAFASAGADATEDDDTLRDRARRFFTTVRRGTLAALEAAALGVAGVRKASAFEVIDALGRPARSVQLVITDAFTEQFVDFSTVPPKYPAQSQVLTTYVNDALADTRAFGVYVQVLVANVVIQPVQLTLAFQAGADVSSSALQARAAVVSYINALSPGASFVAADVLAVLANVPGLSYTGGELLSPSGDVVAKPLQVLRTSLGLVSAVASQTDTPLLSGTNPDAFSLASG